MAAFATLVKYKNGKRDTSANGDPRELNAEFKAIVLCGGDGLDEIELHTSRQGRVKRKKFKPAAVVAKKATKKAAAKKAAKVAED